jgi:hypothetical protein
MAVAVSLPIVVFFALLVSATLMLANARGLGVVASAGVLLLTCVVVEVVQGFRLGYGGSILQVIRIWLVFLILPAVGVLAVSRLPLLKMKPWLLLLLGPPSFMIALVVVVTAHNMLFASWFSR